LTRKSATGRRYATPAFFRTLLMGVLRCALKARPPGGYIDSESCVRSSNWLITPVVSAIAEPF